MGVVGVEYCDGGRCGVVVDNVVVYSVVVSSIGIYGGGGTGEVFGCVVGVVVGGVGCWC